LENKDILKNSYFRFRNISENNYVNFSLPFWIKNEIDSKDSKILDYGCGFGQIIEALKKEGFANLYGVDIEKNAIDYCLNKYLNVKEIDLINHTNPFNERFDIIMLLHVIEHIPKHEIIDTLSFIKKDFLAKDGKLLIAVPNAQSNTNCYWAYEDWTHSTIFTAGSLYYVLKAAGFENIEYIDVDCTLGSTKIKTFIKKFFLAIYKLNIMFWNKITSSSYHQPSTQIFSYEIKAKAF
jgi:2-polyprenyl-3-methyl-5-hydroxy-6-metoxy-1,4-benzoquinol methylase